MKNIIVYPDGLIRVIDSVYGIKLNGIRPLKILTDSKDSNIINRLSCSVAASINYKKRVDII